MVDPVEGIVAVAEEPVRPTYLPDGGVEQDPGQMLDSVLAAGQRALVEAGRPVGVVSLANQGETVLAWDRRNGTPLSPAIVWQDRRAESVVQQLTGAADWVRNRTGLVLDAYFSAPKMAWLRQNVTREGVVTTTDTWLVHQLCGEFVTDVSTASRSLLTDLDSGGWDPELLGLFDWQDEALPRIVDCDEAVGVTRAFGPEMVVAGLVVDQQAALLAEACIDAGSAKCTFGTGAFLLANLGSAPVRSASGLTTSIAWRARGDLSYCLDGQVYTAGSAVRWLQDLGLITDPSQLDLKAARQSDGTLCVPSLAGLAAPWWRSDATAVLSGMTLSTGTGQVILAVLQGIAAQVAELGSLVTGDLGSPLSRLRVDGGLTRCRTLMQSTADLIQTPVDIYPSDHATALGAATFGRLSATPTMSVPDAIPDWSPSHTFEPTWTADEAEDFMARWRRAVAAAIPDTAP